MEDEIVGTSSTESGIDMGAALEDISSGLGFETAPEGGTSDEVLAETASEQPVVEVSSDAVSTEPTPATPAPKTWRADAAAKWAQLPPEVQAEVVKREEDIFRGLEGYKADATFGKSMQSVLDPYLPTLRQHGIDPLQQVAGLMNAHFTLATGTAEQKQALFVKLAQDYGVSLDTGEVPYVDPAVSALQSKLNSLESKLSQREQQDATQHQAKLRSEIDTFASAPEHKYFDEVAADIAGMLKSGAAKDLSEAYEKAVWANPVTRAKEQARLTAEATTTAVKVAKERAEAARKASAANVRSSAKPASGTALIGSIDDTLSEALAAINSRA